MKNKNTRSKNIMMIIQWVIIIALVVTVGFFGYQYWKDQQNPQEKDVAETLKEKISSIAVIPDEAVRVTVIDNVDGLKSNPFFTNATNGDQLLIFENGLLLIYNPDEEKVVAMQYFENSEGVADGIDEVKPDALTNENVLEDKQIQPTKITILNGSADQDAISELEALLIKEIETVEVVERIQAGRRYTEGLVIDDGGSNSALVLQISTEFGFIQANDVPSTESLPQGEVVIIIGDDFNP